MVPFYNLWDYHIFIICKTLFYTFLLGKCVTGALCIIIPRLYDSPSSPPHNVCFSSSLPPSPSAVPVDRLPMLLIANLQDIRCTTLSGSTSRLPSISTKQTMAMDFIYANETVCWIDVGDTPAATQLKCASIPDLKTVTNTRTINISLSLHRE